MTSPLIYNRLSKEKNGRKLEITIQQVTPDLMTPVIDHMVDHFLDRECLCGHIKLKSDPVSLQSIRDLWAHVLNDGTSIVALLKEDGCEPTVIGCNVTTITRKDGPDLPELPGELFQVALGIVIQITDEANLWEKYGVDSYLSAFGLSVHKDYHGLGLGEAILNAREKVCKAFQLPMTETVFTGSTSQYLATKSGFHTVVEHPYKELTYAKSEFYRDLPGKLTLMVKSYQ